MSKCFLVGKYIIPTTKTATVHREYPIISLNKAFTKKCSLTCVFVEKKKYPNAHKAMESTICNMYEVLRCISICDDVIF